MFLAFSLERGGAERQLVNLAIGLHERGHDVKVVVFRPGGELEKECELAGIPVGHLQNTSAGGMLGCFLRLVQLLKKERPAILHSYLPVVNVAATLAAPLARIKNLVWGVRSSFVDFSHYAFLVRLADRLQRYLAFRCQQIIANSEAGKGVLVSQGIDPGKIMVIPNGIDIRSFSINRASGHRLRSSWGIDSDEILVGLVGRLDPMKDHETFLSAVAVLASRVDRVRFVCVGGGSTLRTDELQEFQNKVGLEGKIVWGGEQSDMPSVMNALDMLCLSSKGEGFPNVLGEALACGVPCVSTDVGDASVVIDDPTSIVIPRNPEQLAEAMERMITRIRDGHIDRVKLRDRVVKCYSIKALIKKTEDRLLELSDGLGTSASS
jgi:glycosyltransferase involved in cell wall biosynthesis